MSYTITLKTPWGDETFQCNDDQIIMDAAEDLDIELPHSCRAGACDTCVGRLISGSVDQADQTFLDDSQVNHGFVLLCVTYPKSDCVISTHEEEELLSESCRPSQNATGR